jgi:hypothetical protein
MSLASLSLPPLSQLVVTMTHWGRLLVPPPIAFDAPHRSLVGGCGRCSPTTTQNCHSTALHKDSPDRLLARGVPYGDVKELLHDIWLFTAEIVHQGLAGHVRPEHQYNVGVVDLVGEFMTFSGKTPDVIQQGHPLLMLIALYMPRVAVPHICALEIAGKDLLEILPVIDRVSGQVIEPGSGRVGQVDGEELNDEEVAINLTCPTREAVVL